MSLERIFPLIQPDYLIIVDGQDITSLVSPRLVDLQITDNRGFEADQVDVTLDDTDGDLALPSRGVSMQILMGFKGEPLVDKGHFIVSSIEHTGAPDQLIIRGRSADMRTGITTKKERTWHDTTVGDIVRKVSVENGLQPVLNKELDAQSVPHIDQTFESDANLLSRLAEQFDAISTVKSGRLLFVKKGRGITASGGELPTFNVSRRDGDTHRFVIDDRDNYSAVRATYYDVRAGKKGEVIFDGRDAKTVADTRAAGIQTLDRIYGSKKSAEEAVRTQFKNAQALGQAVSLVQTNYKDRKSGQSGVVVFDGKKTYQEPARKQEPIVRRPIETSADNIKTLRHTYASKLYAERAALAEFKRIQRGVANFSLTLAKGRPELFPECPLVPSGWKQEIDQADWLITKTVHRLNTGSGLTTEIIAELFIHSQ